VVAADPKTKHADCIVTDGRQTEDSEPSTTSKIAARWQKNDANMKNEHSVSAMPLYESGTRKSWSTCTT